MSLGRIPTSTAFIYIFFTVLSLWIDWCKVLDQVVFLDPPPFFFFSFYIVSSLKLVPSLQPWTSKHKGICIACQWYLHCIHHYFVFSATEISYLHVDARAHLLQPVNATIKIKKAQIFTTNSFGGGLFISCLTPKHVKQKIYDPICACEYSSVSWDA